MYTNLKKSHTLKHERGFTLIELIVVISIIALLATLVTTAVFSGRSRSRDMGRVSDLEQIKLGLKLYKEAYGEYPDYEDGVELGVGAGIDAELQTFVGTDIGDPLNDDEHRYVYDSDFTCGGQQIVALYATTMEDESWSNVEEFCDSDSDASVGAYILKVATSP